MKSIIIDGIFYQEYDQGKIILHEPAEYIELLKLIPEERYLVVIKENKDIVYRGYNKIEIIDINLEEKYVRLKYFSGKIFAP